MINVKEMLIFNFPITALSAAPSFSVWPLFTFASFLSLVYFPCRVVFYFPPFLHLPFHFPLKFPASSNKAVRTDSGHSAFLVLGLKPGGLVTTSVVAGFAV